MKPGTLEEKVNYLMDRAAIADVMGRYCLGMDMRNWDMYRSCWADDVTFDVSTAGIHDVPFADVGIDVWIRALQAFFSGVERSQHVKYPVSYEFSGDSAVVYAIMQGKHWAQTPTGDPLQVMVGYYRDTYKRTDKGWKMSATSELLSWNEGNFGVLRDNIELLKDVLKTAV